MVVETVRRTCAAGYQEGTLRTYLDGEMDAAESEALRAHAQRCAACSEQLSLLRMDGALVQGRLALLDGSDMAVPPRPPVAAVLAAARREARAGWQERVAQAIERLRTASAPAWRPVPLAVGAAAGVLLLGGVAATQPAVQSFAQGIVQSLRVQKVQPVTLDLSQVNGTQLPGIDQLLNTGTYSGPLRPTIRSGGVADAKKATGLTVRAPSKVPAQVGSSRSIWISDPITFTFTYDGQKLAALAQQYGVTDATLLGELRGLNGATVKGSVPAAAAVVYGDVGPLAAEAEAAKQQSQQGKLRATEIARRAGQNAPPLLALIQLKTPSLDVPSNVNVDRLREQLLRSGAIPPALAGQLLAIQDWKSTLPVPVIRGAGKQVPVDGVTGALVTEEHVNALFWQKDGVLYVMSTSGSEQDLLDAARSLAPAK